jgi:hypothetical protein
MEKTHFFMIFPIQDCCDPSRQPRAALHISQRRLVGAQSCRQPLETTPTCSGDDAEEQMGGLGG